jgi:hypothetical protein
MLGEKAKQIRKSTGRVGAKKAGKAKVFAAQMERRRSLPAILCFACAGEK